jgi:hypothetical protein
MQPLNANQQTKKSRHRIPVITQERLRDCLPVEHLICLDCGQVQEQLRDRDYTPHCLQCLSVHLMNAVEHRMQKSIAQIDTLTLSEWCRILPTMIALQHRRGNKQTALFLESKLSTLQQL